MTDDPFARAAARVEAAESERRRERRSRATTVVGGWASTSFRIHASVFVAVNLLLAMIYLLYTPGATLWFLIVFFAWGIGLVAHWSAIEKIARRRS